MTQQQYRSWLREQLVDIAAKRYPGNTQLQLIYQIGFLEQLLAGAMHKDSRVYEEFTACIEYVQEDYVPATDRRAKAKSKYR
jgi:hypothetical protein